MIYFNPLDEKCKSPFGAVKVNETVTFNIECNGFSQGYIYLNEEKKELEATKTGFTLSVSFDKGVLIFYYFMLVTENGIKVFIENSDNKFTVNEPTNLFQLTVYETDGAPKWFREGIAYQIFPDRFAVGEYINRTKNDGFIYENWNTVPQYIRNEKSEIATWDYFGGNLRGIIEKLDYIKSLNVSVIYLNPIFESNSNHRYSTADYSKIDSMLGTEEDFKNLIAEADKRGIKIILDGVFSHVGADSIYFNKFRRYGDSGAYNDKNSPYFPWFKFKSYPNEYESWWGVYDLPDVDELNESYIDYILTDENSIVKKWTKMGIGGWRLDVADEIPDEFLEILYRTVKEINPDAVIIGEVWEDASNKIAYGKQRTYFTRRELDCVMNYPMRDNLLAFFRGEVTSFDIKNAFDTLMENYPHNSFYGNFNSLGTHDVSRIYTICKHINQENAETLLKTLVNLQFTFPGTPCIYYGDEAGLEGAEDPDNRRTFPWGKENTEIAEIYKTVSDTRNSSSLLKSGKTKFIAPNKDVFGIIRYTDTDSYTILANRASAPVTVNLDNNEITIPAFGYVTF